MNYCDLPKTILDGSVFNIREYSAKKLNIFVFFSEGLRTDGIAVMSRVGGVRAVVNTCEIRPK